jgi:hypothetical protein
MGDRADSEKMDDRPQYDSSMSIIGWLPVTLVIWALGVVCIVVLFP